MSTTAPLTERKHFRVPAYVFAGIFAAWRTQHEHADSTSAFDDADRSNGTRFFIDGFSGYGIRPGGELVYVHSFIKGQGDRVVADAVQQGAVYLDCFDGHLTDLYARHGFREVSRVPNWTPDGPAVVYMALPGYASRHGVAEPVSDSLILDQIAELLKGDPWNSAAESLEAIEAHVIETGRLTS